MVIPQLRVGNSKQSFVRIVHKNSENDKALLITSEQVDFLWETTNFSFRVAERGEQLLGTILIKKSQVKTTREDPNLCHPRVKRTILQHSKTFSKMKPITKEVSIAITHQPFLVNKGLERNHPIDCQSVSSVKLRQIETNTDNCNFVCKLGYAL